MFNLLLVKDVSDHVFVSLHKPASIILPMFYLLILIFVNPFNNSLNLNHMLLFQSRLVFLYFIVDKGLEAIDFLLLFIDSEHFNLMCLLVICLLQHDVLLLL